MPGGLQPTIFAFDRADLSRRVPLLRDEFARAQPFPHIVVDGLVPDDVLDGVLEEFPEPEAAPWQEFDNKTELKLALADTSRMGPVTRNLLAEFNGQAFVEFLESVTGIDGLVPDPHYAGGGLHQIRAGGFLKVHADFNWNARLRLYRRLNALLYLNRDWDSSYGGALELWDREMNGAVRVVPPVFNRMVLFATNDDAFHGHPEPLTCPPERARRSLALYYYSNDPAQRAPDAHSTLFQRRPGERFQKPIRDSLRRWIPPAISDFRRARNK